MTFLDSIKIAIGKANLENEEKNTIVNIFEQINADLQKYSENFKIVVKDKSQNANIKQKADNTNYDSLLCASINICHRFGIETYAEIATLHKDKAKSLYVIKFEDQEHICKDTHELREALISMLSSLSFGLAIMSALKS